MHSHKKNGAPASWLVKDIKGGNADIPYYLSFFMPTPLVVSKCAIKIYFSYVRFALTVFNEEISILLIAPQSLCNFL